MTDNLSQIEKGRLAQLRAWGYGILTQNESDELEELEAVEAGSIKIIAYTDLGPQEIAYWKQRSEAVLGQPTTITFAVPISFNRHDFSGAGGTIRPTSATTFTIDDIDSEWFLSDVDGIIKISDGEGEQVYRGFWNYGKAYFSVCGCEREDADPRIAFAQVLHNI